MVWRRIDGQGRRVIPRAAGCVLVLYDRQWEDEEGLLPVGDPIPVSEWLAATRQSGYLVSWTPEGALAEGPYRGGVVVEVADARGRSYIAVPPEGLDHLEEIMSERDYQMVREDVAALANPEGHGLSVTRLDRPAWELRGEALPHGDPLPTETWAQVIRRQRLRVESTAGVFLPLDSAWPGGEVVAIADGLGRRRSYFAVPRGARRLVAALADETADAASPVSPEGAR
jgi:hypothetical protein